MPSFEFHSMRSSRNYALALLCLVFFVSVFLFLIQSPLDDEIQITDQTSSDQAQPNIASSESWTGRRLKSPDDYEGHSKVWPGSLKRADKPHVKLKDIINSPSDMIKFNFDTCTMSNCFDFARCNSSEPIKVHIVPSVSDSSSDFNMTGESNIIHRNILDIIRRSKHYESNPDRACIFVLEDDTLDRDPLSKSFRSSLPNIMEPRYGYGMNYLMFNLYSGSWPDYKENDFAGFKIGATILAKASNSITFHRANFDVSIPLFSYLHGSKNVTSNFKSSDSNEISKVDENRTYFLTFKGKRYVVGSGSATRNSLYHLNNQRDVIMLTTCRHGKKWQNSIDGRCLEDASSYDQYDFVDLMKESTFCLTPRGRRLGSFRFLEAISYGCIPVILSDGWVWPFGELIDWSNVALQYEEDSILLVPDMLRDIRQDNIKEMRRNCDLLYRKYFSSIEKIVLTTLAVIERRVESHISMSV